MTDKDEEGKGSRQQSRELAKRRLDALRKPLEEWKQAEDKILTTGQIEVLYNLAEKNMLGTQITSAQRQMKTEVHQAFRNALADFERMVDNQFMTFETRWVLSYRAAGNKAPPFDPEKTWREDLPISRVSKLVQALVEMFGDDYAVPIAKAVEEGLGKRQTGLKISVPVVKTMKLAIG